MYKDKILRIFYILSIIFILTNKFFSFILNLVIVITIINWDFVDLYPSDSHLHYVQLCTKLEYSMEVAYAEIQQTT